MVIIYEQVEEGKDYLINCFLAEGERLKKRAPETFNLGVACKEIGIDTSNIKTLEKEVVEKDENGEKVVNRPVSKEKIEEFIRGYNIPEEELGSLAKYYKD